MESSAKQRDMTAAKALMDGMKNAAAELAEHLERYRQSA
jgi:hypothetical protein